MTAKKEPAKRKRSPKSKKMGAGAAARRKANPPTTMGSPKAEDGLQPNQVIALCALLRGATQEQAAAEAKMTRSGIRYLLTVPVFKEALAKAQAEARERAQIDADGIIRELMPILKADIREFFDGEGVLKPVEQWTEPMGKSVASIENEELFEGQGEKRQHIGTVRKVKFWPKVDAADKIARIIGAYKPLSVVHSGRVEGLADVLNEVDGSDVGPGPSR